MAAKSLFRICTNDSEVYLDKKEKDVVFNILESLHGFPLTKATRILKLCTQLIKESAVVEGFLGGNQQPSEQQSKNDPSINSNRKKEDWWNRN